MRCHRKFASHRHGEGTHLVCFLETPLMLDFIADFLQHQIRRTVKDTPIRVLAFPEHSTLVMDKYIVFLAVVFSARALDVNGEDIVFSCRTRARPVTACVGERIASSLCLYVPFAWIPRAGRGFMVSRTLPDASAARSSIRLGVVLFT